MSFIRAIGKCLINGVGFDLHENKDGSATIRPVKLANDLPKKFWRTFDSVELANDFIESFDLDGAQLVHKMKQTIL